MTVCLDDDCPLHTNQPQREAIDPPPTMPAADGEETDEEATQRMAEHEQRMAEYRAEQERKEAEHKAEYERQQKEYETEQTRREKLRNEHKTTFERINDHAPSSFNAEQMRFFLRLLIQLDYSYLEDVAIHFSSDDDNEERSEGEIVLAALDATADEKLTNFALRIVLSDHIVFEEFQRHNARIYLLAGFVAYLPWRTHHSPAAETDAICSTNLLFQDRSHRSSLHAL